MGVEYGFGQVQALDVQAQPLSVSTESDEFLARSVIIATGGERNKTGNTRRRRIRRTRRFQLRYV